MAILLIKKLFFSLRSAMCIILMTAQTLSFAFNPWSNQQLDELEKEFVEQINLSPQVIREPLATQYINQIGKKLARHGQMSKAPVFFIVRSGEINAFAGPGGYIGINSQLILTSENESEMAAVMAHEAAHVRQHHLYRMLEHQKQMRMPMLASLLASAALGVINPAIGSGAMMASMTGFAQDTINYTRAHEKEADRIGIDMLYKADFNPKSMATFFSKMQQHSRYFYTDNIPAILRTHPLDNDRIAEAQNRSAQWPKKLYDNSIDYPYFKELIRTKSTQDEKRLLDFYQKQCSREQTREACQYGLALVYNRLNQYQNAINTLNSIEQHNNSLFLEIALIDSQTKTNQFDLALEKINHLLEQYPDHQALLIYKARILMAANKSQDASLVLLKASRLYPNDLVLCEEQARAEAASGKKGYAYLTQSRCMMLQGRARDAVRQLKVALDVAGKDPYIKARALAKIDEIKSMSY